MYSVAPVICGIKVKVRISAYKFKSAYRKRSFYGTDRVNFFSLRIVLPLVRSVCHALEERDVKVAESTFFIIIILSNAHIVAVFDNEGVVGVYPLEFSASVYVEYEKSVGRYIIMHE